MMKNQQKEYEGIATSQPTTQNNITTFVGVVLLSVRKNHHHNAGFITFRAVPGNLGG
jgi:hypothetical protein